MAKKQPLNNRINKEAMFKKIMPSASARQKAPERPAPSASGGDELLDGLSDDLIDLAVGNFGDDLLDQLPSQPRVFATPGAPTAPVPPPPSVTLPQEPFEGYAIGEERQAPAAPQEAPQYAPPQEAPPQASQGEAQEPLPPAYPPQYPSAPDYQQSPPQNFVPTQPQNQGYPPPGYVPTQPMPGYPAPYPYPYPPYPYPPQEYPYPPQEHQAPEPAKNPPPDENDGMPRIEQMPSATVVADSASVVTDTVVIQENSPASARDQSPAEKGHLQPPKPREPEEEPEQPPDHEFQPEMELEPEATHLLDDYDAFPPLSEGDGDVVNIAERIVSAWLDDAIAHVHGCCCEKCRLDVAAFTLNRLAPQYVLAEELTEEALCSRKTVAETVEMVYKAAFQVKTFPRH